MTSIARLLVAAGLLLQPCAAFDILLFPAFTRTNQIFFESVETELRLVGHDVTLLVFREHLDGRVAPPGAIVVPEGPEEARGADATLKGWEQKALVNWSEDNTHFRSAYSSALQRQCSAILDHANILEVLRKGVRPNLVLADVRYGACALALGRLINAPVVGVEGAPPPFRSEAPLHLPAIVDRNDRREYGFWDRLRSSLSVCPKEDEVFEDLSMVLVNGFLAWDAPVRPVYPKLVFVGGLNLHVTALLPKDLEAIAREHRAGIILVTLVSSIPSDMFPNYIRTSITDGLGRLPHAIFWKANLTNPSNLTRNMFVNTQFQAQNIMGHVRTRLVISFCDRDTVFASIHHRVPLLCIPVLEDQVELARRVEEQGIGVVLKLAELNPDSLVGAVQSIITDASFRERVKYHSDLLQDQLNTASDRLVFWTRYVILRKGAPHLRNPAMQLHLTLLDIWVLVTCTVLVGIVTALTAFALSGRRSPTKVEKNKKSKKHKNRKSE